MPTADGSSTRGGCTSVRGRVRSPHISGGSAVAKLQAASVSITWGSCAPRAAASCDRQTDRQTDGSQYGGGIVIVYREAKLESLGKEYICVFRSKTSTLRRGRGQLDAMRTENVDKQVDRTVRVARTDSAKAYRTSVRRLIGHESVPKIIINDAINLFSNCYQHFGSFKP